MDKKVAAVICEYNPFHNGHKIQFDNIRKSLGEDTVILSLMSGNFVQRGMPALFDKYSRAKSAVMNGADLVLELTTPFSFGCGEDFARGAVGILNRLNCVDYLVFGSECGSIRDIEEYCTNKKTIIRREDSSSYASSLQNAYLSSYPDSFFPSKPNDILACEYVSALNESNSSVKPLTFERKDDFSAHKVRKAIADGEDVSALVPDLPDGLKLNENDYGLFACAHLAVTDKNFFENICYMNGGVDGLIKNNIAGSDSFSSLIENCTSLKYPSSRIRRAILCLLIGVTTEDMRSPADFTVLLAASENGRKLLSDIRKKTDMEIVTKPADMPGGRTSEIQKKSDLLFSILAGKADSLIKSGPFIKK